MEPCYSYLILVPRKVAPLYHPTVNLYLFISAWWQLGFPTPSDYELEQSITTSLRYLTWKVFVCKWINHWEKPVCAYCPTIMNKLDGKNVYYTGLCSGPGPPLDAKEDEWTEHYGFKPCYREESVKSVGERLKQHAFLINLASCLLKKRYFWRKVPILRKSVIDLFFSSYNIQSLLHHFTSTTTNTQLQDGNLLKTGLVWSWIKRLEHASYSLCVCEWSGRE